MIDPVIRHIRSLESKMPIAEGKSSIFATSIGEFLVEKKSGELIITKKAPDCGLSAFSRCIIITLESAKERQRSISEHLDLHNIKHEFLIAHEGAGAPASWRHGKGAWGCLQSHRNALRQASTSIQGNVLILEDDARLVHDFHRQLTAILSDAPPWDALWLGGTLHRGENKKVPASKHLFSASFYSSHCILVNRSSAKALLERLDSIDMAADNAYNAMSRSGSRIYCPNNWISYQAEGFSFIQKKLRNAETDRHRFVSDKKSDAKVSILSIGTKRAGMARNSFCSFSRAMPNLLCEVLTTDEIAGTRCRIVKCKPGFESRRIKTRFIEHTDAALGVLVDDDTICTMPFESIEKILAGNDLALAADSCSTIESAIRFGTKRGSDAETKSAWLTKEEAEYTTETFKDCGKETHFNTGVIFYRDAPEVRAFCRVWQEEWTRFSKIDQFAFFRAQKITGIKITRLPERLHKRAKDNIDTSANILHFCSRKWKMKQLLESASIPWIEEKKKACCGGAFSFISSAGKVISGAAKGTAVLCTKQERHERLIACNACNYLSDDKKRCSLCSCPISRATRFKEKECPADRWKT